MKSFVVILVVVYFTGVFAEQGMTNEQKEKLKQYKETCMVDTGVDAALIESAKKGEEIQSNEKLNCFSACMLKKIGIMKPDGSIDEEVARSKVPPGMPQEKFDETINNCKTQIGNTPCETGGKLLSCLLKSQALPVWVN